MLKKVGYKGLQEHVLQRAVYLKNFAELKQEASLPGERGMFYELSVTANQIVVNWIVANIMNTDRQFGAYSRQSNA